MALADRLGRTDAVSILVAIYAYYADRSGERDSVLTTLLTRLSAPAPRDVTVTRQLSRYKGLDARWHAWSEVVRACQELADALLARLEVGR